MTSAKNESLVYGTLNQSTFDDFVKRLSTEQSGGRPHCTADPMFTVQNCELRWSRDGETCNIIDSAIFIEEDQLSSYEDALAWLVSHFGEDSYQHGRFLELVEENFIDTDDLSLSDIAEYLNEVAYDDYDACVLHSYEEWVYVCSHLTPEAARAFIERKRHDYRKLRVYAESMYMSWEIKAVVKGIVSGEIKYVGGEQPAPVDLPLNDAREIHELALSILQRCGENQNDQHIAHYARMIAERVKEA